MRLGYNSTAKHLYYFITIEPFCTGKCLSFRSFPVMPGRTDRCCSYLTICDHKNDCMIPAICVWYDCSDLTTTCVYAGPASSSCSACPSLKKPLVIMPKVS